MWKSSYFPLDFFNLWETKLYQTITISKIFCVYLCTFLRNICRTKGWGCSSVGRELTCHAWSPGYNQQLMDQMQRLGVYLHSQSLERRRQEGQRLKVQQRKFEASRVDRRQVFKQVSCIDRIAKQIKDIIKSLDAFFIFWCTHLYPNNCLNGASDFTKLLQQHLNNLLFKNGISLFNCMFFIKLFQYSFPFQLLIFLSLLLSVGSCFVRTNS